MTEQESSRRVLGPDRQRKTREGRLCQVDFEGEKSRPDEMSFGRRSRGREKQSNNEQGFADC